eukprot:SM000384S14656  [mRNA]  locus=s384:7020:12260:+ [translate_table: standard]
MAAAAPWPLLLLLLLAVPATLRDVFRADVLVAASSPSGQLDEVRGVKSRCLPSDVGGAEQPIRTTWNRFRLDTLYWQEGLHGGQRRLLQTGTSPDLLPLQQFKAAVKNPMALSSWTGTNPCAGWFGITCNAAGRVITLQLPGQKLTGTMPSSLGNLTSLTTLHLYNNNLSGSIPSTFGNLRQLSLLQRACSGISDELDPMILSLREGGHVGNLDNNTLTGSIPTTLCQLSQLTLLHLAINKLTGTIPKNITQLPKLVILIVNNNKITGAIPTGLENLTHLTKIVFGSNLLTGSIPSGISKISNLTVLDLGNNKLTGAFPTWINNLKQLQQLYLSGNNLTGSVPSSLGTVTTLTRLNVSRNTLSGPFPASVVALVNVTKLKMLDCSSNYFNGSLPKPKPSATGGGIVTNFSTNCFGVNVTSSPAGQRSFAQCATFYHIPIPPPPPRSCMKNTDCPLPAGYSSSCASTSCSGRVCRDMNLQCYNNRTGVDSVCSRDTCDGHGRCVTQPPRDDPPGGDYSCDTRYEYGIDCVQYVCR